MPVQYGGGCEFGWNFGRHPASPSRHRMIAEGLGVASRSVLQTVELYHASTDIAAAPMFPTIYSCDRRRREYGGHRARQVDHRRALAELRRDGGALSPHRLGWFAQQHYLHLAARDNCREED